MNRLREVFLSVAGIVMAVTGLAQTDPPQPATATPRELTAADADAWLDGLVPYALHTGDIAGAVVVIVKDGAVLTERGYGFSDVAKRTPVDPRRTLFRPDSVSKLVTWTAVMQLSEQGKIDLDADLNQYLDFKIPPRHGLPITMRNLLQHTAGFEEQAKGILTEDPKSPGFETLLKQWTPRRVYEPGATPAYSNYGASLAGYIVQRVSGEPFDTYVEQHIFMPLEMSLSTFRQPLPADLAPSMAHGYRSATADPSPFEIVGPAPAGAMSLSGDDMAHFMIAHLQDGEYHGQRVLSAETARTMHNSPLTILPPLNRMELGFFETNLNGREVIGHLGDTQNFHTALHLFLAEHVGFYVSFSSPGRGGASSGLRSAMFTEFADRYFPAATQAPEGQVDPKTAAAHAALMTGHWENSRGSRSNFLAFGELFGQTELSVNGKGELVTPFQGLNGQPRHWIETAPFVWRDRDSHERLAAQVVAGRPLRFSIDSLSPFMVFDRPPWYGNAVWLKPAFLGGFSVLVATVIAWPIWAIGRRHWRALRLDPLAPKPCPRGKLGALLLVAAVLVWMQVINAMMKNLNHLSSDFDGVLRFAQVFGFLGFLGGAALMFWHLRVVWNGRHGWRVRAWSVVLSLSALSVLWPALIFHLVGWGVYF